MEEGIYRVSAALTAPQVVVVPPSPHFDVLVVGQRGYHCWSTVHRGQPDPEGQCGPQGWISTSFLFLGIRTSWLSHPGQTALCLSFPSVKGPCSSAWQGCAECLPTGLGGPIHTFCQAKAGQFRCHHHQSRNRFASHSLELFKTAWAAVVLQGCTSCCVQRCHQLRLSHGGGRVCHAPSWLSPQCCCMTITPQCLSFPIRAVRLLALCSLQGSSRDEQRYHCSHGHPRVSPPIGMAPEQPRAPGLL